MPLTVERTTRVPREPAFAWFTDFSPEDTHLVSMLRQRAVTRAGPRELFVENTVEVNGERFSNRLHVRLDPPRAYDCELDTGTGRFHLRFEFFPEGAGTRLRVTVDEGANPEEAAKVARGIGRNIDELFPQMEKELGFAT